MKTIYLLVIATLFLASSVSAQVFTSPRLPVINVDPWVNLRMGQMGNQMAADMARASLAKKKQRNAARPMTANKPGNSPNSPPIGSSLVFRKEFGFAASARSQFAEALASGLRGTDAEKRQQASQLVVFAQNAYRNSFKDEHERLKMPMNDVVSAMTYFIISSYMTVKGLSSLESERSVAVYDQLSTVFQQNGTFAKMSEADKQTAAEALLFMAAMPQIAYSINKNSAELKQMSRQNIERLFGDKMDTMQITGFGIEF
ncbi:MAG: hypothetical protein QM785_04195 [Pyrinomonadaceae bacterium]